MPFTVTTPKAVGLALLFLFPFAHAQSLRSDGHLHEQPDGAQVAPVKRGANAQVLKRQGFWVQVKASGKAGWVRLNQLSFGAASGMVALDTGRATADNIVSTSVARGLSAKDFIKGKPDTAAVAKLDALMPDAGSVDRFSNEAGVKPVAAKVALKRSAASATAGNEAANHDN